MHKVVLLPLARRELREAVDYITYNLRNPIAAKNFLEEFRKVRRRLSNAPEIFMIRYDLEMPNIRSISIKNYIAFYRVLEDSKTVEIIHITHGSRDYQRFFDEE